jgi:hypothetical protein
MFGSFFFELSYEPTILLLPFSPFFCFSLQDRVSRAFFTTRVTFRPAMSPIPKVFTAPRPGVSVCYCRERIWIPFLPIPMPSKTKCGRARCPPTTSWNVLSTNRLYTKSVNLAAGMMMMMMMMAVMMMDAVPLRVGSRTFCRPCVSWSRLGVTVSRRCGHPRWRSSRTISYRPLIYPSLPDPANSYGWTMTNTSWTGAFRERYIRNVMFRFMFPGPWTTCYTR